MAVQGKLFYFFSTQLTTFFDILKEKGLQMKQKQNKQQQQHWYSLFLPNFIHTNKLITTEQLLDRQTNSLNLHKGVTVNK